MDPDKMTQAMARWWQTVNERADDPDARPMLYDPLQGGRTSKTNQYLATVIICLGAAAAGTGLSWTSPVKDLLVINSTDSTDSENSANIITNITNITASMNSAPIGGNTGSTIDTPESTILATTAQFTWIASLLAIGAIVGAVPSGIIADKIGRKKAAILITIPYIISWLITVFAQNIPMLYIARFLIGIAVGGSCVVCPVYISEFAETSIRGMLGTCFQLFLTVGILFVYILGFTGCSWVILSWFCLILPILNLIGLCFLPESPTWLLKNRRDADAATAIKWYWGRFCNANNAIQAMKNELDSAGSGAGGIRELFSVTANRKGFLICVMLMFFQQFSGINAVIFFAQSIFKDANTGIDPAVCTLLVGVVQVLMTFVSAGLVERAGRRLLLIISSTAMCLCLAILGGYFLNKTHEWMSLSGIVPLASVIIFIVSFSLGYGPIPWMMMGEMLSADIKGIATSLTVEFNWISVFIITKYFEPLKGVIGDGPTFLIFSVIMAFGTLYGITILFETKGKSNTEIQMKLAGHK